MGQQQLLLLILSVIIVGIAIFVGIMVFNASVVDANKNGMLHDLQVIFADAEQYMLRSESAGGGQGSFDGYVIPPRLAETEFGTYEATITHAAKRKKKGKITLVGTSSRGYGTISMVLDDTLNVKKFQYTGSFK